MPWLSKDENNILRLDSLLYFEISAFKWESIIWIQISVLNNPFTRARMITLKISLGHITSQCKTLWWFPIPCRAKHEVLPKVLDLYQLPSDYFSDAISYPSLLPPPSSLTQFQPCSPPCSSLNSPKMLATQILYTIVPSTCSFPRPPSLSSLILSDEIVFPMPPKTVNPPPPCHSLLLSWHYIFLHSM